MARPRTRPRVAPPDVRPRGRHAAITLSESDGVRYLHFGTIWVQGAMRIAQPYALELEYQRQMMATLLFIDEPRRILQLGLGAAALTKYCHRFVPGARVTTVEIDPGVVDNARRWFRLPPDDDRLQVVVDDALAFLVAGQRAKRRAGFDWVQVDLYDAAARGPVYDDVEFYHRCRAAMNAPGVAAFNLFGSRFERSFAAIGAAFDGRVLALPEVDEGNRVALALCGPPVQVSFGQLFARARELEAAHKLPLRKWVSGLRAFVDDGRTGDGQLIV
ncbi:MAG TPA: spermidine synthase [Burkholderiaceae bacterium]|nr:spermidine synthase [Burkholderiaceae bacterium]